MVHHLVIWAFIASLMQGTCFAPDVQDAEYWYEAARSQIQKRLRGAASMGVVGQRPHAKNVVYFVGDGMSLATVTAARLLRGQRQGKKGEEHELVWDMFPAVALAKMDSSSKEEIFKINGRQTQFKTFLESRNVSDDIFTYIISENTYNADSQTGESAACATALMCGVKANFETIGLDVRGRFENCFSSFQSRVSSLADWAQQSGKSIGIVTNTRITHATPAALFGHAASRYWEDDSRVPPNARRSCKDLARQLVEDDPGRNINVLLGGGRRHWLPKVARDPETTHEDGRRLDGRNLIDDWLRDKKKRGLHAQYVWNKDQLDQLNPNEIDFLLGLFAYSHMDFEADRESTATGDPSLADMTRMALRVLQKNSGGFFLFVEGGRIDHAHHFNNAYRALDETLAMETALLAAMEVVDPRDTLFVVTADHSHVMSLGGHATPRGHPVLGPDSKVSDVDGQPYTTILYGNGPGYSSPRPIPLNVSTVLEDKNAVHGAAVPRKWATHGGEDVPVYALGPFAQVLFSGTVDQSYIPHAIAYAACLGPHAESCNDSITPHTHHQTHCVEPEVSGVGVGVPDNNAPVVIASSVMIDESTRTKVQINASFYLYPKYVLIYLEIILVHLFIT